LFVTVALSAAADPEPAPQPVAEAPSRFFHQATPDVALAGRLRDDALATLEQAGVRHVIDLRYPDERPDSEGAAFESAGIRYSSFPTGGRAPTPTRLAEFAALMDASAGEARVLYCNSGNRAGLMWGLYRLRQGVPLDQVMTELGGIVDRPSFLDTLRSYAPSAIP
jgi:uncharacterized protein (TIGR01244 family)